MFLTAVLQYSLAIHLLDLKCFRSFPHSGCLWNQWFVFNSRNVLTLFLQSKNVLVHSNECIMNVPLQALVVKTSHLQTQLIDPQINHMMVYHMVSLGSNLTFLNPQYLQMKFHHNNNKTCLSFPLIILCYIECWAVERASFMVVLPLILTAAVPVMAVAFQF